jgi:O-antigen/teichoic acid export membrane protein
VLVAPLITRLFAATDLGIYGVALAFVGIAGPVAGLRFELAAISARDTQDARALTALSALSIIPVTVAATAVLCVLKVLDIGSYGALSWPLVAIAGGTVAAAGVYSTLRCWLARQGQFRLIASSLALQGCLRAAIPVLLAPLAAGAALLLSAEFAARASSIWLMARSRRVFRERARLHLDWSALRTRLQLYWKYPLLLAPSALIDAAATMVPIPILASYYGLAAAGKFALVQRLVLLPAALIVGSVGDVFHAHAATVAVEGDNAVGRLVAATAQRLLLLALVVYVPVAVLAPFVAGWLFGVQWSDAGPMMTLLVPLCIAQTTVSPISRGLLLSGREERKLIADVVCLALPVLALHLARHQSLLMAIACFSVAATIAYVIYYFVIVRALKSAAPRPQASDPAR